MARTKLFSAAKENCPLWNQQGSKSILVVKSPLSPVNQSVVRIERCAHPPVLDRPLIRIPPRSDHSLNEES